MPLDSSLKKFEEGIKLAKRCETALGSAEKKIERLTKSAGGEVTAKAFEDGDDSDDDSEDEEDDESDEESGGDDDGDGMLF